MNPFELLQFINKTGRLLDLERRAEIEETVELQKRLTPEELERRGRCLLGARLDAIHATLGGRTAVELIPGRGQEFVRHQFQNGDVVMVRRQKVDELGPTGVVERVYPDRLRITLDGDLEQDLEGRLRIDRVTNDTTYRRLTQCLVDLGSDRDFPGERLRAIFFGQEDPSRARAVSWKPIDPELNPSQIQAIDHALAQAEFALIHGPPGTGKTTTLVELIHQIVLRDERVLASAPSNVAVDNLVERLLKRGLDVVRLGHPARLNPEVIGASLEAKVEASADRVLLKTLRRDLDQLITRLTKTRHHYDRKDIKQQIRYVRRGIRDLEQRVIDAVIDSAQVVLATNVGAGERKLDRRSFDWVVIDEAAQALECGCWIPLLKGERAVLAGDHCQLPPTILSNQAAREGLNVTLFERLEAVFPEASALLTVQYRMHDAIMGFSSNEFYAGQLTSHPSVAAHTLADLEGVVDSETLRRPLVIIDTAGFDAPEEEDEEERSRSNPGEVRIVKNEISRLIASGVSPRDIGVITPYRAQVRLLRREVDRKGLEIDTVDGFQGREKEVILLSLVRSNDRGEVGFLSERRRLNVALTRARRQLVVIGDSSTVSADPFIKGLIEYLSEQGQYLSAWELDLDE